jgi:hypothetical protein
MKTKVMMSGVSLLLLGVVCSVGLGVQSATAAPAAPAASSAPQASTFPPVGSGKGIQFHEKFAASKASSATSAGGSNFLSIFQEASATPLNVSVDGSTPVSLPQGDFLYGLVSTGTHQIVATNGNAPFASGSLTVAAGENVTSLIYLAPGGSAHVGGFRNEKVAPPLGQSRIVYHNTADSPPVDIYLNGKLAASGLANNPSAPTSVSALIPAGLVNVVVTTAGGSPSNPIASVSGYLVSGDLLNVFVTGTFTPQLNNLGILTNAIPLGTGYRLYASDGGVFDFGNSNFYGSMGGTPLNKPIVGAAPTSIGLGYWMAAADGGVFSFGDAQFYGSAGNLTLNKPVVGMADAHNDNGYWLVASDGGIFSYGGAKFYGSTGNLTLNKPIVGMATTSDGNGYWLVASDGGVFSYGDAHFYGSTGSIALNKPIVAIVPTVDGRGYWLVAADGGVFSFGDANFYGSTGSITLNKPIVSAMSTPDSQGYWMVASDGGVFSFGDATFYGSTGGIVLNKPIVAASPAGSPLPT